MTERFSDDQVELLKANLDRSHVKNVDRGGRSASYVEGYHVINEANRIFGFGGWQSSITDLTCVESSTQGNHNYEGHDRNGNPRQGYLVAYTARVRVTVEFGGLDGQSHEDVGYGEGIDYSNVGQAHESAIKEAVTDAEKRALRHWGNQFGLALYDKEQREVSGTAPAPRQASQGQSKTDYGVCPIHNKPFLKSANMKEPAHPIKTQDDTGQEVLVGWCNKSAVEAAS